MKKKLARENPKRLGRRITKGLTELRDVLQRGQPLGERFRINVIDIPDPEGFMKRLPRPGKTA